MSQLEARLVRLESYRGFTPHECAELSIHTGVERPSDDEPGTYRTGLCRICRKPMR